MFKDNPHWVEVQIYRKTHECTFTQKDPVVRLTGEIMAQSVCTDSH